MYINAWTNLKATLIRSYLNCVSGYITTILNMINIKCILLQTLVLINIV